MDTIKKSLTAMIDLHDHHSRNSSIKPDIPSDPSQNPKVSLMSLPDELLLQIIQSLSRTCHLASLTNTNKRLYHIAGKQLYNPSPNAKYLIGSIRTRMRAAIQTGNTAHFDTMFTRVSAPWGSYELAQAINLDQEYMALRLLTHPNVRARIVIISRVSNQCYVNALIHAVTCKMYTVLRAVLQVPDINPNVYTKEGRRLLHLKTLDYESRRILLRAGANATSIAADNSDTTIRYALRDPASFEMLLRCGARPSRNELWVALGFADLPILDIILRWNLDPGWRLAIRYDQVNRERIREIREQRQRALEQAQYYLSVGIWYCGLNISSVFPINAYSPGWPWCYLSN